MPDGPGRFPQGFTCPAVLRSHWKEDCIFIYGAVTLYGRPFQTVLLTLSYPSFNHFPQPRFRDAAKNDYCGPATPDSPCGSSGLGCSEFARHYYRNHGCFLFLWVLRWFTSLGSLHTTMNSSHDNQCSHWLGSPIRKSPDHRLLASPRGLSQLATSFIAYLRQGIHTHALSSLTIKFTLNTEYKRSGFRNQKLPGPSCPTFLIALPVAIYWLHGDLLQLCSCPSIFNFQRTFRFLERLRRQPSRLVPNPDS